MKKAPESFSGARFVLLPPPSPGFQDRLRQPAQHDHEEPERRDAHESEAEES
jgi:hypothetical protein